jgi:hypothetical protein
MVGSALGLYSSPIRIQGPNGVHLGWFNMTYGPNRAIVRHHDGVVKV